MSRPKWDRALERVGPLLVGIELSDERGSLDVLPGVPAPGRLIAAAQSLLHRDGLEGLLTIRRVLRPGQPPTQATFAASRPEWGLCALQPQTRLDVLPAFRFSHTLVEGEELAFVDFREGRPFVLETAAIACLEMRFPGDRPWERSSRSVMLVEHERQRSGLVVIDDQGRVAGITEMDRKLFPGISVGLPAEFIDRIGVGRLISGLVPVAPQAAVDLHRARPSVAAGDPWALCAAGQAFEMIGEFAEARRLWAQALALDPQNAWLFAQLRAPSGLYGPRH